MKSSGETVPLEALAIQQKGAIKIGPFGSQLRKRDLVSSGIHVVGIENVLSGTFDGLGGRFISPEKFQTLRTVEILPGDLLITMMGTIGKVAIVPEGIAESIMDSHLLRVRIEKKLCRTDYLAWAIYGSPAVQQAMDAQAHGAIMRGLNSAIVRSLPILLPPLPEQKRIVDILDEAFDGTATVKANAEKNLWNSRELFESYLQAVFTQRGKGWVDRQLASLCHKITVGHVGAMKTEYKESGVPFLRSQNIRPFEVSMDNAMFIDEEFHLALKKSQLRPGDLAIVRTGYPGTAAVIPSELPDSNCSDLVIVRPTKEVNPHFLAAFFNSAFGKQLVLGKIVGAAQKHFNITAAKEVMLHVPPVSEQLAIVSKLRELREETERLASVYEGKLAAVEALKKSLLHEAFTGQL